MERENGETPPIFGVYLIEAQTVVIEK